MSQPTKRPLWLTSSLLIPVVAILGLASCAKGDPVKASVWAMPDVVWDDGAAPSGGAESSAWVKEFRAYHLMVRYVWATADASYPEYVEQVGYDEAVQVAEGFRGGGGDLSEFDAETGEYVPDAPSRWDAQRILVTRLSEDPGGEAALIDYCFVLYAPMSFREEVQCAQVRATHSDDGWLLLDGEGTAFSGEEPAVEDIPTARWATPITKPTLPGEAKLPLPREYYVELGVISE